MRRMTRNWLEALRREDGQTIIEYALIIFFISVAFVVTLQALAGGIGVLIDDATALFS
jgi:Flp pilus assembly pilin Flp